MEFFVTGGSGFVGQHLLRALDAAGHHARALARSPAAADAVASAHATPVPGDLADASALDDGARGCDVVLHAAALTAAWGDPAAFHAVNVDGTANVLAAARRAGTPRLVHLSSEAVLADGRPLVRVDETYPRPAKPAGHYPRTKGLAEDLVRAANSSELATVVVRPRLVWGPGDTTVLPAILDAAGSGRWAWIDGGRYPTSTCHVRNACEGILLAAERGGGGQIYFLTDGEPVEVRAFLAALAATAGVDLGDRSVPRWLAGAASVAVEAAWRWLRLRGEPPLTRTLVALGGQEMTVDDGKARRELGYVGRTSREDGLAELAALSRR